MTARACLISPGKQGLLKKLVCIRTFCFRQTPWWMPQQRRWAAGGCWLTLCAAVPHFPPFVDLRPSSPATHLLSPPRPIQHRFLLSSILLCLILLFWENLHSCTDPPVAALYISSLHLCAPFSSLPQTANSRRHVCRHMPAYVVHTYAPHIQLLCFTKNAKLFPRISEL